MTKALSRALLAVRALRGSLIPLALLRRRLRRLAGLPSPRAANCRRAVEDLNELSFDRMGVVLGLDHDEEVHAEEAKTDGRIADVAAVDSFDSLQGLDAEVFEFGLPALAGGEELNSELFELRCGDLRGWVARHEPFRNGFVVEHAGVWPPVASQLA